jgi:predicted secreted hydrolase
MKLTYRYIVFTLIGLAIIIFAGMFIFKQPEDSFATGSIFLAGNSNPEGFARALPPATIEFPADFGPHPDFQTEWWYYTGNLATPDNRRFGYQLTIFRRALLPPSMSRERASTLGTDQIYLGHLAITDVQANMHTAFERFARGASGISGAQAEPYRVWLEDWEVIELAAGEYHLQAGQDDYVLDLFLTDLKGPVLQGINGYSQKGPDPGNASYYYSQTRLQTSGTIQIGNQAFPVSGYSWKDHEYSTSALSGDQVGWDWFAIQFSDMSELKVFYIRRSNGQVDDYSSGSFVDAEGNLTPLGNADFSIVSSGTWTSDESGATYPSEWTINVPTLEIQVQVAPLIPDQELTVSYAYWEGAIRANGIKQGLPVDGYGYAELTGYAQSMAGEF